MKNGGVDVVDTGWLLMRIAEIGATITVGLMTYRSILKKGITYKWLTPILGLFIIIGAIGYIIIPNNEVKTASIITQDQDKDESEPIWNTQDLNVETNGNIAIALRLLRSDTAKTATVERVSAGVVFKAPWKYYGEIIELTGEVSIAQDYPPGGSISTSLGGGEVGELVLMADDGTIIDYMHLGSTGAINVGDTVAVNGYCIGHVEVENKLGGTTTQLMVVGKGLRAL